MKYSMSFKKQVISEVKRDLAVPKRRERAVMRAACKYKLTPNTIYRWFREFGESLGKQKGSKKKLKNENLLLREEVIRLRKENNFLKEKLKSLTKS